jgi:DNA-binding response OmpR family regulator
MVADNLRGWTLGCDGYVTKPLDLDELVSEVERVLDRDPEERRTLRQERIRRLSGD